MIIPIAAAFLLLLGSMMTSSCNKDFLEKPFSVTFNEDSVFVKYENTIKLVNDMYNAGPYYLQLAVGVTSTTRLGGSMLESATDFGGSFRANANYGAHKFNFGTVDAEWLSNSKTGEDIYSNHYKTIRKAFTLLGRIDEVPDAAPAQKERIKAEAQTMIAFQYFELM